MNNAKRRRLRRTERPVKVVQPPEPDVWCNVCSMTVPGAERYVHLSSPFHEERFRTFAVRKAIFDAGSTSPCDPMR